MQRLINKHQPIFEKGIGKLKGPSAKFQLKPDAKPILIKARKVPFALRDKVNNELKRLEKDGIISPVKISDYATPIVPVIKRDGSVRICADFKVTLNKNIEPEQYPLTCINDIFASLAGSQKFSKIDITSAYLSMEVDPEHRKYLTISTELGLFEHNRLLFGVTDAPAKWQRAVDSILEGIPFTKCILDDILVGGTDDNDHIKNLDTVMARLKEYGLKVNQGKCTFMVPAVTFCGHKITAEGLQQDASKTKAEKCEGATQLSWPYKLLPPLRTEYLSDIEATLRTHNRKKMEMVNIA